LLFENFFIFLSFFISYLFNFTFFFV
jgi:hypothetical protein